MRVQWRQNVATVHAKKKRLRSRLMEYGEDGGGHPSVVADRHRELPTTESYTLLAKPRIAFALVFPPPDMSVVEFGSGMSVRLRRCYSWEGARD